MVITWCQITMVGITMVSPWSYQDHGGDCHGNNMVSIHHGGNNHGITMRVTKTMVGTAMVIAWCQITMHLNHGYIVTQIFIV